MSGSPLTVTGTPFVGRASEMTFLAQRAAEAQRGEPRVVLLAGDAGMGKSSLLSQFLDQLPEACVVRASGEESESLLQYGLVGQLLSSAGLNFPDQSQMLAEHCGLRGGDARSPAWSGPLAKADPLLVGADLVAVFGQLQSFGKPVVLAVDDLHWADTPSAIALLFALRRIQDENFLGLFAARLWELGRLGEGWSRFAGGDRRADTLHIGGLAVEELQALARAAGSGELTRRAAGRLLAHTGGSPQYCLAILAESDLDSWACPGDALPVPSGIAGEILASFRALTEPARELIRAAAVLGRSSSLSAAAALAELPEPVLALDDAVGSGLVTEVTRGAGNVILFAHPLGRRAIYDDIGPAHRRGLHQRAAGLVGGNDALAHRIAVAVGPDADLAVDLELAATSSLSRAASRGETGQRSELMQSAVWLSHASVLAPAAADRGRLLLDAVEVLLRSGDVAEADALAARVAGAGSGSAGLHSAGLAGAGLASAEVAGAGLASAGLAARGQAILGLLDLLAGRLHSAEARFTQAWHADPAADQPVARVQAATGLLWCCVWSGRPGEAVVWGECAVAAAAADAGLRQQATQALSLALGHDHRAAEALAWLAFLAPCAAEVPAGLTDALTARGIVRVLADDLETGAADLAAAASRIRSGLALRHPGLCLGYLAEAEWHLGIWDDAALNAALAVQLTQETGRAGELSVVHSFAARVPAGRGNWDVASRHVLAAGAAARSHGSALAVAAWATARAALAAARGDHEEVLRAAASVRATGRARAFGRLGVGGWRALEADALICMGDLDGAIGALAGLGSALSPASQPAALMTAARLRGTLAAARGDAAGAAQAFDAAWGHARGLDRPFLLAQLELADGRRLRESGRRPEAIARLRAARARLERLQARPYLTACDQELVGCGVQAGAGRSPETFGLTSTELSVASLVASGRSNRETAAELYVSVKAIEFHLSNIFTKLGINSRHALAARLGEPGEEIRVFQLARARRAQTPDPQGPGKPERRSVPHL